MNVRRLVSLSLVVSLVAGLLPSVVWAREEKAATAASESVTTAPAPPAVDLRTSARQVVAKMPAGPQQPVNADRSSREASPSPQGGGGAGTWIMMAVGTAVSIGMAYYLIKQTKKVQTQAQNQ